MSLGGLRQMSGDRKTHSRTLQVKHRLAEGGDEQAGSYKGQGGSRKYTK